MLLKNWFSYIFFTAHSTEQQRERHERDSPPESIENVSFTFKIYSSGSFTFPIYTTLHLHCTTLLKEFVLGKILRYFSLMISQKGKEKNHIKNMKIKFEYIFSAWTRIEWEFRGENGTWAAVKHEHHMGASAACGLVEVKGTRALVSISYFFGIFEYIFRVYYIVDSCLAMNTPHPHPAQYALLALLPLVSNFPLVHV